MLVVNSLCKNIFLIFFSKFPVFSLSGKMDFQIPCFPCAVATLPTSPEHDVADTVTSSIAISPPIPETTKAKMHQWEATLCVTDCYLSIESLPQSTFNFLPAPRTPLNMM